MNQGKIPEKQFILVLWVIWAAFIGAIPFLVVFLRPISGEDAENFLPIPGALAAGVAFLASAVVRWVILPRVSADNLEALLQVSVIGMALAESLIFFGIFLFPEDFMVFLVLAVVGLAQFVPLWARIQKPGNDSFRREG